MQNIFIARQPVYDRELHVVGYELLFRARDTNRAEIRNGDEATAQVILNSFINMGIESLVGSGLAFINVPEALVQNDALLPMFHEQTVLEILETVRPRPEVIEGLRRLKQRGFRLALDDFVYRSELYPLVDLADYIKLDVKGVHDSVLASRVAEVMRFGKQLVAERVETEAQYQACRALGFTHFQGYFFCHPETLKDRTVPPNKLVVLQLMQELANPDLDVRELEATLSNDIALSYKLMRYVNSAALSVRREIESLKVAIVLVGFNTIRNWAALVLLNSINAGRPPEIIKIGMIRARMCELIAQRAAPKLVPQMFITGLFSVLDAVMAVRMETLLDNLVLAAPIKFALVNHEGELGKILAQVLQYERGEWEELLRCGGDRELLVESYIAALHWADKHMDALFR